MERKKNDKKAPNEEKPKNPASAKRDFEDMQRHNDEVLRENNYVEKKLVKQPSKEIQERVPIPTKNDPIKPETHKTQVPEISVLPLTSRKPAAAEKDDYGFQTVNQWKSTREQQ